MAPQGAGADGHARARAPAFEYPRWTRPPRWPKLAASLAFGEDPEAATPDPDLANDPCRAIGL